MYGMEEELRRFAIAVSREVCIRTGVHKPATEVEKAWAREGLCLPRRLETVIAAK